MMLQNPTHAKYYLCEGGYYNHFLLTLLLNLSLTANTIEKNCLIEVNNIIIYKLWSARGNYRGGELKTITVNWTEKGVIERKSAKEMVFR